MTVVRTLKFSWYKNLGAIAPNYWKKSKKNSAYTSRAKLAVKKEEGISQLALMTEEEKEEDLGAIKRLCRVGDLSPCPKKDKHCKAFSISALDFFTNFRHYANFQTHLLKTFFLPLPLLFHDP